MDTDMLKYIGGGVECKVYRIDNNTVYKEYGSVRRAKFAYIMQRLAHKHKLAPKAYEFDRYGYKSEFAEPFDIAGIRYIKYQGIKDLKPFEDFLLRVAKVFGEGFFDHHSGNVASYHGEFCLIDFGIAGFWNTRVGIKLSERLDL